MNFGEIFVVKKEDSVVNIKKNLVGDVNNVM